MQASQEPHPAQQPEEASDGPQEQIGPYKATYHASGVSSTVYRAKDPETGELIAVKVTLPSMMSAPHNSRREARILRAAACPHVLDVATMSLPSGHFLLTFPFVRHNFADLLRRRQLRSDQIRTHLAALFQALGHIHGLGIIHRDVKPSNLLIASPDGPVYLTDFGIAWQQDDPDSELAHEKITDVGTTCYRPPELLFGHSGYTEKLDLWAAGCVMAEAVTQGESLFDAGDVGSELALIKSIFSTLGTPIDSIWPVRAKPKTLVSDADEH